MSHEEYFFLEYMPAVFTSPESTVSMNDFSYFYRTLKDFISEFNSVGNQFIAALGNYADNGKQVHLLEWNLRAALAIICKV